MLGLLQQLYVSSESPEDQRPLRKLISHDGRTLWLSSGEGDWHPNSQVIRSKSQESVIAERAGHVLRRSSSRSAASVAASHTAPSTATSAASASSPFRLCPNPSLGYPPEFASRAILILACMRAQSVAGYIRSFQHKQLAISPTVTADVIVSLRFAFLAESH